MIAQVERRCVVALDVGGTFLKGALVSMDGSILTQSRVATRRAEGADAVVDRIYRFVLSLIESARARGTTPAGLGLAVPGHVDEERGIAMSSTNLGWHNVALRDRLGSVALPIAVRHDVRAGGVAESRLGAGRGWLNQVFIPIGTGIGCAIVMRGHAFAGDSYAAGEIGHIPVAGSNFPCGCGRVGCLETVASAAAISRRFHPGSGLDEVDARQVAEAVLAGDEHAARVWLDASSALAQAIVYSYCLLNIDHYIIGGGLSLAGSTLLVPLRRAIEDLTPNRPRPAVVGADLGDNSGCIGAALAMIDELGPQPA